MASHVKFIRVRGRVVPIKTKKGQKNFNRAKTVKPIIHIAGLLGR